MSLPGHSAGCVLPVSEYPARFADAADRRGEGNPLAFDTSVIQIVNDLASIALVNG